MSVSPVCPRCGQQVVVRPGSTAQAWCHLHGAVTPLHHAVLVAHDAISAVTADARVPAWVPDPMPAGWAVTGLAWGGEPGESPEQAIEREVREETALSVRAGAAVGRVRIPGHDVVYDVLDLVCTLAVPTETPVAGDDADAVMFADAVALGGLDCTPLLVETLREWGVLPG